MQTKTGIILPDGYDRVKVVGSLASMFADSFEAPTNCVISERTEPMPDFSTLDFTTLFNLKADGDWKNVRPFELERALNNAADESQFKALTRIRQDIENLNAAGGCNDATLVLTTRFSDDRIYLGSYDFHFDGSSESNRYGEIILCNYTGLPTEWIRNEDAVWIENSDNQFTARENAPIFEFNKFSFWRMKTEHSKMTGKPFIHRGLKPEPGTVRSFLHATRPGARP